MTMMRGMFCILFLLFWISDGYSQWEHIGPTKSLEDGRIYEFNGNWVVMSGLSQPHFFRSTDDGLTWLAYSEGLPDADFVSQSSIAANRKSMIFNTAHVQQSWFPSKIYLGDGNTADWRLSIDPTANNIYVDQVWIYNEDTLLYQISDRDSIRAKSYLWWTTDNGNSAIACGMPDIADPFVIYEMEVVHNRIFMRLRIDTVDRNYRAWYFTDDLGSTWSPLSFDRDPFIVDTNLLFMTLDPNNIVRSTTMGKVWDTLNVKNAWPYNWDLNWMKVVHNSLFAQVTAYGASSKSKYIYSSNDLGVTWKNIEIEENLIDISEAKDGYLIQFERESHLVPILVDTLFNVRSVVKMPERHASLSSVHYVSHRTIFATLWQNNHLKYSSLVRSDDDGETWDTVSYFGSFQQVYGNWFELEGKIYSIGWIRDSSSIVLVSNDGGVSWQHFSTLPYSEHYKGVTISNDTIIAHCNHPASICDQYSVDGGITWAQFPTTIATKLCLTNTGSVVGLTDDSRVRYRSNVTGTWKTATTESSGKIFWTGFASLPNKLMLIGYSTWFDSTCMCTRSHSQLQESYNGGSSFTKVQSDLPDSVVPMYIFPDSNGMLLLLSSPQGKVQSDGRTRVLVSKDEGRTWKYVPGYVLSCINVHSNSDFIFLGNGGLYRLPRVQAKVSRNEISFNQLNFTLQVRNRMLTVSHNSYNTSTIEFYDMLGKLWLRHDLTQPKESVHLPANLIAGSYVVRYATRGYVTSRIIQVLE